MVQGKPDIAVETAAPVDENDHLESRRKSRPVDDFLKREHATWAALQKSGAAPDGVLPVSHASADSSKGKKREVMSEKESSLKGGGEAAQAAAPPVQKASEARYNFGGAEEWVSTKEFAPAGQPMHARIARDLRQVSTWSETPMERNKFGFQPDGTFIPEPEKPQAPSSTTLLQNRLEQVKERAAEIRAIFSAQAKLSKSERMAMSVLKEMRAELRQLEQEGG